MASLNTKPFLLLQVINWVYEELTPRLPANAQQVEILQHVVMSSSANIHVFLSPQNPYVEILMPDAMVLGGGSSGRWSDHKALKMRLVLLQEMPPRPLAPSTKEEHRQEGVWLWIRKTALTGLNHAGALIWDLPISRAVRSTFRWSILLEQPKWTETLSRHMLTSLTGGDKEC